MYQLLIRCEDIFSWHTSSFCISQVAITKSHLWLQSEFKFLTLEYKPPHVPWTTLPSPLNIYCTICSTLGVRKTVEQWQTSRIFWKRFYPASCPNTDASIHWTKKYAMKARTYFKRCLKTLSRSVTKIKRNRVQGRLSSWKISADSALPSLSYSTKLIAGSQCWSNV